MLHALYYKVHFKSKLSLPTVSKPVLSEGDISVTQSTFMILLFTVQFSTHFAFLRLHRVVVFFKLSFLDINLISH
jgi:hypothetical protein